MSDLPPPPPPNLLPYATPAAPAKPTSLVVIAIIGIVWASLSLLQSVASTAILILFFLRSPTTVKSLYGDQFTRTSTATELVVNLALSTLLMISSIGALKLKPRAYAGLVWYGILRIAYGCISLILLLTLIAPHDQARMRTALGRSGTSANSLTHFKTIIEIEKAAVILIFLAWPIIVLIFMKRPNVKAAFAQSGSSIVGS